MNISANTLILAIRTIDQDIKRRQTALRDAPIGDEDIEERGQYVLDLARALSELIGTYEKACRDRPDLPPLDSWLKGE
jgi:hypothetical protein